ncbi:hypothetical protein N7532_010729 [Penicillium argentinense]|uniref:RRM domain-containing protein n=1 Tax=Penicillium argentinense TaxID=1131581 RepID=A0A9W9EQ50_9EURO|nr:uncharacterized protein N7532_010729 [Penicillium argentinense]KAJ5085958.1 hypothetical protein N7532_010729 [Penicillium argentinense]
MAKIFVGGLAWATDETSLRHAFEPYGEVQETNVVREPETGRSRGFGFVKFYHEQDAERAIEAMNGQELDGRRIRVDHANERPRPDYRGDRLPASHQRYRDGGYGRGC